MCSCFTLPISNCQLKNGTPLHEHSRSKSETHFLDSRHNSFRTLEVTTHLRRTAAFAPTRALTSISQPSSTQTVLMLLQFSNACLSISFSVLGSVISSISQCRKHSYPMYSTPFCMSIFFRFLQPENVFASIRFRVDGVTMLSIAHPTKTPPSH